MKLRPALKWLALITGALPVLIFLLLAVVLFSETAAKSIWSFASDSVPGLRASEVSGRLVGPLEFRNLHFSNETLSVDAAHIAFDWQLEKLVFGELYISSLRASELRIHSHGEPTPKSEEPLVLPDSLPLPVIVRLADARVNDVRFQSGDAESIQIDVVQLRGQVGSGEVFLEQLSATGPQLTIKARLNTQLWNNYKTDADINWRYDVQKVADTSGNLTAKGDLDGMRINLHGQADNTDYGNFELTLKALASTQLLKVSEALLQLKNTDTFVSARGDINLQSDLPVVDAQLDWHNMRWPLQTDSGAAPQVSSQQGSVEFKGAPDSYLVSLNGEVSTPQVPGGLVTLDADGDRDHVQVSSFNLQALRGAATGKANINWADGVESSFQLSGEGLDPGELFPEWPGAINFELQGTQTGNTVTVPTLSAKGIIREQSVILNASATYDGKATTIPELRLRTGETRLDASGSIGDVMDFKWDLDSPDLNTLLPGARGAIASAGSLSGALATALVKANVRARNVQYDAYSIGTLNGKASVDLGSVSDSVIDLDAKSLLIAGTQINSLSLEGSGRRENHTLLLRAGAEAADVDLHLQGGLQGERWLGQLQKADITPADLEAWTLEGAVKLVLSAQEQTSSKACWLASASSICLQGNRLLTLQKGSTEKINAEAQLTVKDFSLAYLKSLLPPDIELDGVLNAQSVFKQTSDQLWTVSALANSSPIQVTATDKESEQHIDLLSTEPGKVTATGTSIGGQLSVRLPFKNGGGIEGELSAADNPKGLAASTLGGGLTLDIPALDIIAAFVPELKTIEGKLNATVGFAGTVMNPEPTGELSVADGAAELATPGLLISDITLNASTKRTGEFVYSGSAVSDGGSFSLKGSSTLGGETPTTELAVKGKDFQLWNTAEARVWASPDLTVDVKGNRAQVQGKVVLPKARVTPQELPSGAVDVSSDQIIILADDEGESLAASKNALQVSAAVGIELGDDVTVAGFGFKGAIAGDLAVRQRPAKPLVASGELNIVDGEYRAYGQGLVIDQGRILFAGGAIDNPGLSVRALRRPAEDIVVGVNVRGELRQPELNLFSEPSMSQSDQLSWLVLGRPLQSASGAESDYITQAALALGIRGGNSFTKGIGDSLGVDTFAIQTGTGEAGAASDVNQAALVIGKYLTPKLYVSYGVGLLEAVNTVKLRYLMTERWNLETESSAISSGGDVSYSFEK
ncbi:MAG: translocation/assembly module TamB domain-containing protein [Pseudomonadales bacterium]